MMMMTITAVNLPAEESAARRSLREIPPAELRATLKGYPGDWRPDTDCAKGLPEPPRQKPLPADAPRIKLPAADRSSTNDAVGLFDALRQRRSHRAFTSEPLTVTELGFLLWSTQGVTHPADANTDRARRTAPSAGGRYPLETYVATLRVDGLAAGIYRYLPETHELLTVRATSDLHTQLIGACYDQAFVGDAAAVITWTAVPARTEWKYAYLAPRMIAMEAGHACQNLYLACEIIGAGTCAMLGYDQARLDAMLGVDGENEFVVYLAPVGKVTR